MKQTLPMVTVLWLLTPWLASGQESPARSEPASEKRTADPVAPAGDPVAVPVPVVRIPGQVLPAVSAPPAPGPGSPETKDPSKDAPGDGAGTASTGVETGLGWSSSGVGLRDPAVTTLRTNRAVEFKGIVPKAMRSERRGFGGFLSGFANLFNPFAPTGKGIESRGEHWYDGGVQSAPLPRGFRDERMHEPQTSLFTTEFGKGTPDETPAARPAKSK